MSIQSPVYYLLRVDKKNVKNLYVCYKEHDRIDDAEEMADRLSTTYSQYYYIVIPGATQSLLSNEASTN